MRGNGLKVSLTYDQISLYKKILDNNNSKAFNTLISEIGIEQYNRLIRNGYKKITATQVEFKSGDIVYRGREMSLITSKGYIEGQYNCVTINQDEKKIIFSDKINVLDLQYEKVTDENDLEVFKKGFALLIFTKRYNGFEIGDLVLTEEDRWIEIADNSSVLHFTKMFREGKVYGFIAKQDKHSINEDNHSIVKKLLKGE